MNPLDSTESEVEEIVPINLKEIDRLLYVVLAIENDCSAVPQGAFKLTPAHDVQRNQAFKGLKHDEALNL